MYAGCASCPNRAVLMHLLQAYCVPILLYCVDVLPLTRVNINRLDNCINIAIMKIFNVRSSDNILNIFVKYLN